MEEVIGWSINIWSLRPFIHFMSFCFEDITLTLIPCPPPLHHAAMPTSSWMQELCMAIWIFLHEEKSLIWIFSSHSNILICIRNYMICFTMMINSKSSCQRNDWKTFSSTLQESDSAAAKGFFHKIRKAAIILKAKEFHIVGLSRYKKGDRSVSISSVRSTHSWDVKVILSVTCKDG